MAQELRSDQFGLIPNNAVKWAGQELRKLHVQMAPRLLRLVRGSIVTAIQDDTGKIQSWQEAVVGSGGGYAAVRADTANTGRNSHGAITNYLENGHRIRPAGRGKGYRPRLRVAGAYVSGRHFYDSAGNAVDGIASEGAEGFAERLAEYLEAEHD